jgi:hypothetical protein
MSNLSLKETVVSKERTSLNWRGSPSVQRLLDAISSIIAEEFVTIAKRNSDVFLKQGGNK